MFGLWFDVCWLCFGCIWFFIVGCEGEHSPGPAQYFRECPALQEPRRFWLDAQSRGAQRLNNADDMMKALLATPTDPSPFPGSLRFVGHALRLRRKGLAVTGRQTGVCYEEEPGPEELSTDDEEDDAL